MLYAMHKACRQRSMKEIQLGLRLPAIEQTQLGRWLNSWQLGQVMRAQVVDKSPAGNLLLQIGSHRLSASADVPLQKGMLLNLEVNGVYPAPSLKIISHLPAAPDPGSPLGRQRQLLLSQQGRVAAPLLTLLTAGDNVKLLSLLGVKHGTLDPHFEYFSQFPLPVDADALRRAMRQSGFFLEHDLLSLIPGGTIWSRQDLKAMLLRLLGRTNQALVRQRRASGEQSALALLAGLQEGLQGAIATITLKQLAANPDDEPDRFLWSFDLPFRQGDTLQGLSISVRRDQADAGEENEEDQWKIIITVSLPLLGRIDAEIFLRGRRISVVFHAEQAASLSLLEAHRDRLQTRLEDQGLQVAVLRFIHGSREDQDQGGTALCIDEKV